MKQFKVIDESELAAESWNSDSTETFEKEVNEHLANGWCLYASGKTENNYHWVHLVK